MIVFTLFVPEIDEAFSQRKSKKVSVASPQTFLICEETSTDVVEPVKITHLTRWISFVKPKIFVKNFYTKTPFKKTFWLVIILFLPCLCEVK